MADLPGTPKPGACEFCGAPRHTKGFPFGDRIWWAPYGPERCTCPDAVAAFEKAEAERKAEEDRKLRDKIQRIVGESGMGDRFLRRTFSTFQITDSNQKAAAVAKRYADSFDRLLPGHGGFSTMGQGLDNNF